MHQGLQTLNPSTKKQFSSFSLAFAFTLFLLAISHPPPPRLQPTLLLMPPARRALVSVSHSWAEEEEDEEPGSFHQEQSARELENERALN